MKQWQKDWFAKYAPLAQAEQLRSGIPASVTLAQLIEETGWTKSLLATKYNNLFGVKAGSKWKGQTVSLYDKQEKSYSPYRIYKSEVESIQDHSKVLMADRYAKARAAASDPMKMVELIHQAGYATSGAYTKNLQSHIKAYNLAQYDKISSAAQAPTGNNATKPSKQSDTTTFFNFDLNAPKTADNTSEIVIDPKKLQDALNGGKTSDTVISDVFGYETDKSDQEAYDRHEALNPPETLPYDVADAVNSVLTDSSGLNIVGQVIRVVIVLLLVIVAIICLLKMIPGDPLSKAIALTPVGRGAAVAKAATTKVQEATA